MVSKRVSIEYPDEDDAMLGFGAFRILESFGAAANGRTLDSVRTAVGRALKDFPALAGETVTIARRQPWDDKLGRADMRNRIIYLPDDRPTSYTTAYHELGHLAIQVRDERGEDVPTTSEEYCSLFALSKMPVELIDEARVPYFPDPEIPEEEWPDVAAAALAYREEHRNYIQQAQKWFAGAWEGEDASN
jgi:hypothetical protein